MLWQTFPKKCVLRGYSYPRDLDKILSPSAICMIDRKQTKFKNHLFLRLHISTLFQEK